MPSAIEYLDDQGRSPFGRWFASLAARAAVRVTTAVRRIEAGNTSASKPVGQGVNELRIDAGPGYRIYFGLDGAELVILVGGSTKARQGDAIAAAQDRWRDYKARKRRGE